VRRFGESTRLARQVGVRKDHFPDITKKVLSQKEIIVAKTRKPITPESEILLCCDDITGKHVDVVQAAITELKQTLADGMHRLLFLDALLKAVQIAVLTPERVFINGSGDLQVKLREKDEIDGV
jgi:hypothetical protein